MKFEYKLKSKNEDFIVNEVSLRPDFCNPKISQFTYLWLEKSGMTTFDALDHIKKFFRLEHTDVSAEGLKDEDGITSQLISLRKIISTKDIALANKKFAFPCCKLEIKELVGYGSKPLSPRLLHGNTFKMVIRNLEKQMADLFYSFCLKNRFFTFINYYDNQRFGLVGGVYNTHLIGGAIIKNNWLGAFKEFKKSKNTELNDLDAPRNLTQNSCKEFFKKLNPAKVDFFVSSYNSYLWNSEASNFLGKLKGTKKSHFSNIGKLALPIENIFKIPNIFSVNGYCFDKQNFVVTQQEKERNLIVTSTIFPL